MPARALFLMFFVLLPLTGVSAELDFDAEMPHGEVLDLPLSPAQMKQLARAPKDREDDEVFYAEVIELDSAQKRTVRRRTGLDIKWLVVASPDSIRSSCTCELVNTAIDRTTHARVLLSLLEEGVTPEELSLAN